MRKLILKMHTSLDGYVRAASGDVMGWVFRTFDDELAKWEVEELWKASAHLMGRKVYEEMAAHWPTSTEPFSPPMNQIPKVVFSKSVKRSDWQGTRIHGGDLGAEITRLKHEAGKDLLAHGGPGFAQSLAKLGAIDEYRLVVHPAVLGGGLRLFEDAMDLKFASARSFPAGAVALTYTRN